MLWTPLLIPHPFLEYNSGHSTRSGAASTVLASMLGSDTFIFTTGSDALSGECRTSASFTAAAEHTSWSRILGGIHFEFSNRDGLNAGRATGNYVAGNYIRILANIPEPGSLPLLLVCLGLPLRRRRPM